jgi:hypothetical protein
VSGPRLPTHGVALTLTAVTYNLCHHVGSLPDGLGAAGHGTRVADWLDLAAPFLVLVPALLTLVAARADRATYTLLVVGALLYTQGHGIHLAANSIGNQAPGPTAHFWDETAGHLLWYAGVAIVVVALARTMAGRQVRPSALPLAVPLAVLTGVTWASNAIGADLAWAGGVPAVAALAYGVRGRADQRVLIGIAGLAALVFLADAFALGEA